MIDDYNDIEDDLTEYDSTNSGYLDTERPTKHALEALFDIEEGTTMVPYKERLPTEMVQPKTYDEKDNEIEGQFQEVYDIALEAYENSNENCEDVEPKYKARNQEVAAQFLRMALDAANSKSNHKLTKDKLENTAKRGGGGSFTQNNIIMDRNELLNTILNRDAIDVDVDDVSDE